MRTNQTKMRQAFIRQYREETGESEINMHDVARAAFAKGWKMPVPQSPVDRMAELFSLAAREEYREDNVTGMPYRANHAFGVPQANGQITFYWVDIDQAPRKPMLASVHNRREQIVGDVYQLHLDIEHWNRINPTEEPIPVEADFTDDVEWRRNSEDDRNKRA